MLNNIKKGIELLAYYLEVSPSWIILILILLLGLGIVKCLYPWQPKWKSKTTKDKNGNIETKYYQIKIDAF